ncbi:MAG: S1/P1 nuclease [Proteobacteria bacterium]|nr:S1/P1 nuclease [Pseudomonadota bacterium]
MSSIFAKKTFLMLPLLASSSVFAYGDLGHLTVCHVAYGLLTPTAKTVVDQMTKGEPFALQCTWPDQVKRIAPWNSTAGYHFINFEDGGYWEPTSLVKPKNKEPFTSPTTGDLLQMALRAQDKLQSLPADKEDQRLCYLRFLGHIAGDSHQPLHSGRGSDSGGNGQTITFDGLSLYPIRNIAQQNCGENIFRPSLNCIVSQTLQIDGKDANGNTIKTFITNNLHALWDDVLVDRIAKSALQMPSDEAFQNRNLLEIYPTFTAKLQAEAKERRDELKALMEDDVLRWVEYANKHRDMAYEPVPASDATSYAKVRTDKISQLIVRGGYHLAGVLNRLFDPATEKYTDARTIKVREIRRAEMNARIALGRNKIDFETQCDKL